jgi:hypothetical protein
LPVLENGAGILPTPQENLVFVEQASCLFLRMVRASCPPHKKI